MKYDFNPIRWTMAFPPDVDPADIEWTPNAFALANRETLPVNDDGEEAA